MDGNPSSDICGTPLALRPYLFSGPSTQFASLLPSPIGSRARKLAQHSRTVQGLGRELGYFRQIPPVRPNSSHRRCSDPRCSFSVAVAVICQIAAREQRNSVSPCTSTDLP